MKIVVLEQNTPEWLAWRKGGVGSSDAMVLAAHAGMVERRPWMKSLDRLFQEKAEGVEPAPFPEISVQKMERGHHLEPYARRTYEARTGTQVMPVCAESDIDPMIRCSFDGTQFDELGFLELKAPNPHVHELAKAGEIVDYYWPQVAHQALVMWGDPAGWPEDGEIHFASYCPFDEDVPEKGELALVTIPATDEAFRNFAIELMAQEQIFLTGWRTHIPPCGLEYLETAKAYLALKAAADAAATKAKEAKARLIAIAKAAGTDSTAGAGVTTSLAKRDGSIDYERLVADMGVDADVIETYRNPGTEYWTVHTAKRKAAKPEALPKARKAA